MKIIHPFAKDGNLEIGWEVGGFFVSSEKKDGVITSRIIQDIRGKTCPICGKGWEINPKAIVNQYYYEARNALLHETCWLGHIAMREFEGISGAVTKAKLCYDRFEEVENQYGGAWDTPWYKFFLSKHPSILTIGHRKRVYHVEIDVPPPNLDLAFSEENVTKGYGESPHRFYIHAWTVEKMAEYLASIRIAMEVADSA